MKLMGADPSATVSGAGELPGKVNYFIGNDPGKWRSNVPTYAKVEYKGIYPGVDLVYYSRQGQLEYDFVVAPGADPNVIRLALGGRLHLAANGDLVVRLPGGEVRFRKPVIYQSASTDYGQQTTDRKLVDGHYRLIRGQVRFAIPSYDKNRPLVIDPVLSYSTYLGGTDDEGIFGIKFDPKGNIYVAGETSSVNFPIKGGFQSTIGGNYDGFITEFDPQGNALVYSTYIGGSQFDHCVGIAVDRQGGAYVAGYTESSNFPTVHPLQASLNGPEDAFVARIAPGGGSLIYSTYLGGSNADGAGNIAIDSHGNAYVAGFTYSTDFPVTPGAFQKLCDLGKNGENCFGDSFVAKISPFGGRLVYSTYLGGSAFDSATDIAVDPQGVAYITGSTGSVDFPTKNPIQGTLAGLTDAFVTKLDATGSALVYSTYLGGSGEDGAGGLTIDGRENIYVAGVTTSTDFPLANPFQPANHANGYDGFVTKFDSSGQKLVYSTYLGGTGTNLPWRIGVDSLGHAAVIGFTSSTDFPLLHPLQGFGGGTFDAFVTLFNTTGSTPVYSTYLGGSGDEFGYAVNADHTGEVWVGGSTSSLNFPVVRPYQPTYAGGPFDAFLSEITTPLWQ